MKIFGFGAVSGLGWLLDFGILTALVQAGVQPFLANTVSASVAVTFVFIVSTRRIFVGDGRFMLAKFLVFAAYQALSIWAASAAIAWLAAHLQIPALLAKVLVTPFTFYSNFIFMAALIERRLRLA